MKFLFAILSLVSTALTAHAGDNGCEDQYQQKINYSFRAPGQGGDGALEFFTVLGGGISGAAGATSAGFAEGTTLGVAGAGAAVGAGALGVTTTVQKIRKNHLTKALNVIREAKIGDGLALREFMSDLKTQATVQQISNVVLNLDSKGALCANEPLTYSEMLELVKIISKSQNK